MSDYPKVWRAFNRHFDLLVAEVEKQGWPKEVEGDMERVREKINEAPRFELEPDAPLLGDAELPEGQVVVVSSTHLVALERLDKHLIAAAVSVCGQPSVYASGQLRTFEADPPPRPQLVLVPEWFEFHRGRVVDREATTDDHRRFCELVRPALATVTHLIAKDS